MNCQHRGCGCQETNVEREGRKFCSEICAEMEATGSRREHCTCGHPDCAA